MCSFCDDIFILYSYSFRSRIMFDIHANFTTIYVLFYVTLGFLLITICHGHTFTYPGHLEKSFCSKTFIKYICFWTKSSMYLDLNGCSLHISWLSGHIHSSLPSTVLRLLLTNNRSLDVSPINSPFTHINFPYYRQAQPFISGTVTGNEPRSCKTHFGSVSIITRAAKP